MAEACGSGPAEDPHLHRLTMLCAGVFAIALLPPATVLFYEHAGPESSGSIWS